MSKKIGKRTNKKRYPERSKDVPVTQAMLYEVRDELKASIYRIDSRMDRHELHFCEIDKRFDEVDKKFEIVYKRFDEVDKKFEIVDKRFEVVDKKFEQVEKKFEQVDKRFDQVDKQFEEMKHHIDSRFHEMKLLFEEQNARNRIVLDGLTSLFARQERLEKKVENGF